MQKLAKHEVASDLSSSVATWFLPEVPALSYLNDGLGPEMISQMNHFLPLFIYLLRVLFLIAVTEMNLEQSRYMVYITHITQEDKVGNIKGACF